MKYFLFSLLSLFSTLTTAQELNLTVKVNTPNVAGVDPKVFKALENSVREFMNTQKWTEDIFENQERINGNLQITITKSISPTQFEAEMVIQAQRPMFGSDQETPLISHIDKDVTFTYEQFQPFQYVKNTYSDNLTAILSFYAYTILALDYDSFAPAGGEPFWLLTQDIANTVPAGLRNEWTGGNANRSRQWIMENNLSPRMKPLRQAFYEYHRLGLDVAANNTERTREVILASLEKIETANAAYPNSLAIRMFCNVKGNELIEIFKAAKAQEKQKVIQTLSRLDPSNSSKYSQIGI